MAITRAIEGCSQDWVGRTRNQLQLGEIQIRQHFPKVMMHSGIRNREIPYRESEEAGEIFFPLTGEVRKGGQAEA